MRWEKLSNRRSPAVLTRTKAEDRRAATCTMRPRSRSIRISTPDTMRRHKSSSRAAVSN